MEDDDRLLLIRKKDKLAAVTRKQLKHQANFSQSLIKK